MTKIDETFSTLGVQELGLFKRALFLTLGLMFLFVLWRNERFILDHSHPDWAYYSPVRWWLVPVLVELGLAWRRLFANRRGRVGAVLTADIS